MTFHYPMGGTYYDEDGRLKQYSLWWPIVLAWYVDSFFRILTGKDSVPMRSTATDVFLSGGTHQPKDQKIVLTFVDHENPSRQIWGSCYSAAGAREVATRLFMLAEQVEPFITKHISKERILELGEELESHKNDPSN